MNLHNQPRSNARGFTLLEALIALLVLSFGMLAIAGFQLTLSRSSDLAKQRTEALRLAQQKMESLRAYGQVASSTAIPPMFNYTDNVVSSAAPEITTTNATFSRTWDVTANAADTEKWINVTVAWNDRAAQAPATITSLSRVGIVVTATATGHSLAAGDWVRIAATSVTSFDGAYVVSSSPAPTANTFAYTDPSPPTATAAAGGTAQRVQAVRLQSVISKFDPQSVGTLATGSGPSNVRRPKNRNINIPYPAVTLSDGTQSAFIPPPGNVAYVFDNTTGNIVQSCTGLTATTPIQRAINGITSVNTTVTVNAPGHTFVAGNSVTIAGSNAAFNGTFTVVAPVSAGASFTYSLASNPPVSTAPAGGTATLFATLLVEGFDLGASSAVCTSFLVPGYLLTGYVRFNDSTGSPSGEEPNNPAHPDYDTRPLLATTSTTSPLSLDVSNQPTTNGTPAMTCYSQRQQVVTTSLLTPVNITSLARSGSGVTVTATSHGFTAGTVLAINGTSDPAYIGSFVVTSVPNVNTFTYTVPPPLPTSSGATGGTAVRVQRLTIQAGTSVPGYESVQAKFISYACVVIPVDHDLNPVTNNRWWGRVTLNANTNASDGQPWTIGSGNGNYKVCRYSADYNGTGAISNSEHPLWYRGVTGPLDSQNFLVIRATQNNGTPILCPTERPQLLVANPPLTVNYSDDTTAQHQPATAVRSFQCPLAGCGNTLPTPLEPSDPAAHLEMD